MPKFDVEIEATVRKTYRVEANNEDEAVEDAHQYFSVLNDGTDEKYNQDTLSVEEVG